MSGLGADRLSGLKCLSARFVIDMFTGRDGKTVTVTEGLKCLSARFVIDIPNPNGVGQIRIPGSQMPFG